MAFANRFVVRKPLQAPVFRIYSLHIAYRAKQRRTVSTLTLN